jgi:hypothetical protein
MAHQTLVTTLAMAGTGRSPPHGTSLESRGYRLAFGMKAQNRVAISSAIPLTNSGFVAAK